MRFKLTIFLLLANLVVFFVLWRLDHPTAPVSANPKLIPDDFIVDHLVIIDKQKKTTTELVQSSRGTWRIVQPVNWPANKFAVPSFIDQLHLPEQKAVFPSTGGEDLSSYGLDKASVTFEIDLSSGQRQEQVLIGKPTLMNNQLYIRNPADGLIRVVSQALQDRLNALLQDLRDPSVFSINAFDVKDLKIHLAPPTGATAPQAGGVKLVTLEKKGDEWRFETPEQFAADSGLVDGTVNQLTALKAVRFLAPDEPQDPARLGLASPFMTVELTGENDHQILDLGNPVADMPEPQYYAKREDSSPIFIVRAEPFSNLANALQTLRESHFLKFDPEKVSTVTVRVGENEVRVEKLETGANPWQIQLKDDSGKPTPMAADTETMQEFFQDLNNINAISFVTDAPNAADLQKYGLANPSRKVTLQIQGDKPITLLIGENTEGARTRYYAMLDSALSVYEISPEVRRITGFISADPLDFRDRSLDPLPVTANITSLKITRLNDDFTAGPVIFEAAQDAQKSTWADVVRGKPVPVADAILYLADLMKHLRVLAYIQDTFTEHYLDPRPRTPVPWPWRYRLDAGVHIPAAGQTPSQDLTRTYYFTEDKQLFGTTRPQTPEMFTVPKTLSDNLTVLIGSGTPPAAVEPLQQMTKPIDSRAPSGTTPAPVAPASTPAVLITPAPPATTSVPPPAATAP